MENFGRIRPSSIQISSYHVTSIIADDDSVRIEHGDNFENECVSEQLSLFVILLKQKFNCAMDHELSIALPRVYSSRQKDYLLLLRPSCTIRLLNRNIERRVVI